MEFKEQILCDAACISSLDNFETVTTESGLQYKDIVKGKGPSPPTGYQVRMAVMIDMFGNQHRLWRPLHKGHLAGCSELHSYSH